MKFGKKGLKAFRSKIQDITDAGKLRMLMEAAVQATSPQEVLNFIEAGKAV